MNITVNNKNSSPLIAALLCVKSYFEKNEASTEALSQKLYDLYA